MSAPQFPTTLVAPKKGMAIAALVTGLVSLVTSVIPILGAAIGLAAIIVGIIALARKQSAAFSVIGLVLGVVATGISMLATLVLFAMPWGAAESSGSLESPSNSPRLATAFDDGIYVVGDDISAGEYRNDEAGKLCYFFWKDGTGAGAETIDNGHLDEGGTGTVTLALGETFKSSQCGTWTLRN